MAVSLIKTTPEWGIDNAQTGLLLISQEEDNVISERYHLGLQGEEEGVALYNARCNISISGDIPTTAPFSVRMAASLTLANVPAEFINGSGSISSGNYYIFGVRRSLDRENFQNFSLTVRGQPNFAT